MHTLQYAHHYAQCIRLHFACLSSMQVATRLLDTTQTHMTYIHNKKIS